MSHKMVRQTIQCHHLSILASHPARPYSKDVVLEFISTFKPANQRVSIRGRFYPMTLKIVAKALQCGHHHHSDEKAYLE